LFRTEQTDFTEKRQGNFDGINGIFQINRTDFLENGFAQRRDDRNGKKKLQREQTAMKFSASVNSVFSVRKLPPKVFP
jgi:hypothetical protein